MEFIKRLFVGDWARYTLPCFLLAVASAVFLGNLGEPNNLFWDENYHLTSAQKYLAGVAFMETHPPLAKLLMALSEWLIGSNRFLDITPMLLADHVGQVPQGFDFTPSRLPSAVAMVLASLAFFYTLHAILRHNGLALAFSFLFVLDTALIVHSRAAHLDGVQMLFFILTILLFVRGLQRVESLRLRDYALLALPLGLAVATKSNALVLLFCPFIWWVLQHRNAIKWRVVTTWLSPLQDGLAKGLVTLAVAGLVISSIYYVHCGLGKFVMNDRYYSASEEYKEILLQGTQWNPLNFPVMLRDNLDYGYHYSDGVPRLKPYSENEAGSHPILWPLGIKSINYRWDSANGKTSYHQLMANPTSWGLGLCGLVIAFALLLARALGESTPRPSVQNIIFPSLAVLWLAYMLAAASAGRVLYLYHYLLPLTLSWLIFASVCAYWWENRSLLGFKRFALIVVLLQTLSFNFYAPLAYHLPISAEEARPLGLSVLWGFKVIE